jgi:hypothetical protein
VQSKEMLAAGMGPTIQCKKESSRGRRAVLRLGFVLGLVATQAAGAEVLRFDGVGSSFSAIAAGEPQVWIGSPALGFLQATAASADLYELSAPSAVAAPSFLESARSPGADFQLARFRMHEGGNGGGHGWRDWGDDSCDGRRCPNGGPPSPVPEPDTAWLMLAGAAGALLLARRRGRVRTAGH